MPRTKIIVEGVRNPEKLPGLSVIDADSITFVKGADDLKAALPGTDVMFGFGFRDQALQSAWAHADALRWVQWCAAGVDTLLFPELIESDVVVTNAAGVFDVAIAEWVAGMIIAISKDFPRSWDAQSHKKWKFFAGRTVRGTSAAVIGAGGIGRAAADMLTRLGISVTVLASTGRSDEQFGAIHAWSADHEAVTKADWVIAALPGAPKTSGMLDASTFESMSKTAVFMNVGRGDTVNEDDLQEALRTGSIAGAALDVVRNEPLDESSAWWNTPNVVLTPHNSGDVGNTSASLIELFLDNLARYEDGRPLRNVVDKQRGFGHIEL